MKILLHACCGPCSLEPVRLLHEEGHSLTIAYVNSNIHPVDEYIRRRDTLLAWARDENIPVIEGVYDPESWRKTAGTAQRGGKPREDRCRICYRLRLEETARYAAAHGFEGMATTLTVSPYQYTNIIAEELERACAPYDFAAVFRDYRPCYPQATIRSRALDMYRQNYCGCGYSAEEAQAGREERKEAREAEKARRAAERAPIEAAQQAQRERKAAERDAYDRKQRVKRAMRNQIRARLKAQTQEKKRPDEDV